MKNWDEIVKDKLEGYGSALPEGSLSDFRSRRSGAPVKSGMTDETVMAGRPAARRFPLVWVLAPALAAGLAAVLLLRQPSAKEGGVQVVPQPSEAPASVVAEAAENAAEPELSGQAKAAGNDAVAAVHEPVATMSKAATPASQAAAPKAIVPDAPAVAQNTPAEAVAEAASAAPAAEAAVPTASAAAEAAPTAPAATEAAPQFSSSPYIPLEKSAKPVKVSVLPSAAAVAGGGLLAALLTPSILEINNKILYFGKADPSSNSSNYSGLYLNSISSSVMNSMMQSDPAFGYLSNSSTVTVEGMSVEVLTEGYKHRAPLRAGISVRVPLEGRLSLTTGLDYSRYVSQFKSSISGELTQVAHYVGVPVRLDWTLASNRWLDVYVGGGLEGDYCVGASLAGEKVVPKDGFSLSALGAGGIQFNMTDRLGLYVEPSLSYTFPSESRVLETYRSEKPLFFSVSSGLRISFGNKK